MLWIERKSPKHIIVNINDNLKEKLKLELEIIVTDKNGKVIKRHKQKCKSWLKNFSLLLLAVLTHRSVTIVDTAGTSKTINGYAPYKERFYNNIDAWDERTISANAPDNDDSYGILVGSSNQAVSPDDYNLASKISHGTGSGQLDYDTHSFAQVDDGHFSISRSFKNSSGGDVNINEVGIAIYYKLMAKAGDQVAVDGDCKVLIIRDVLDSTVTVPDGGGLTVKYTIGISSDFVKNFMLVLYAWFSNSNKDITLPDGSTSTYHAGKVGKSISGISGWNYAGEEVPLYLISGDNDDSFGILVGSNNSTAWDITQYNLASKIPHGTSSGQLDYGTHTTYDLEELDDRFRIKISRSFYNASGGKITVGEVGLYVHTHMYYYEDYSKTSLTEDLKFMILRKVLPSVVDVDPDATLTVNYYIAIPK